MGQVMPSSPKANRMGEGAAGIPERELPLYLKEIGQVMLLDRSGEVNLCRKIEEANDTMLELLFVLPITMEFVKEQRRRLSQGEILAKHLVQKDKEVVLDGAGDAEQVELHDPEEEEFRQRVIQQLDHLCQCVQALMDVDCGDTNNKDARAHKGRGLEHKKRFIKSLATINWHPRFYPQLESHVRSVDGQLGEVLERLGVSQENIRHIALQKKERRKRGSKYQPSRSQSPCKRKWNC